jgi:hypothetical protein
MMQIPAPSPPRREHENYSDYSDPSDHNVAAIFGLICDIVWPLIVYATPLWNIATHFAPMPQWLSVLISFGLTLLPAAAIMLAFVGLVRSFTQPQLRRSRWQAIVGLIFGVMWVGGYFLLA